MFSQIKPLVAAQFAHLASLGRLLRIDYDGDAIWNAYLNGFAEDVRQEHNCSCCRQYIKSAGTAVVIGPDNVRRSAWDIDLTAVPDEYRESIRALRDYVDSRPLAGLFFYSERTMGTDKTPADMKVLDDDGNPILDNGIPRTRHVVWEHFFASTPSVAYDKDNKCGEKNGAFNSGRAVFKRALDELKPEAIDTLIGEIELGTVYRGNEHEHNVRAFKAAQATYLELPEDQRENYIWRITSNNQVAGPVIGFRNSVIGTLVQDLSEGKDLDNALKAYEHKNAPANYKRPKSAVTPRMVEAAKKDLTDMGLISALQRRRLDTRDLSVANALYTFRATTGPAKDPFAAVTAEAAVDMAQLKRMDEVTVEKFLKVLVPEATSLHVLFERSHLNNLATLTGPVDPDAGNLLAWDNPYAWDYTGGMADAIKEKVKAAGGDVSGWMRISLAWYNFDDLDLHFQDKNGEHVYYGSKRGRNAWLDVDMNAGSGTTREPVENITMQQQLAPGDYSFWVNQYMRRESTGDGFDIEVEVNGERFAFSMPKNPSRDSEKIHFTVAKDGTVLFRDSKMGKSSSGVVKWGLKTGIWHRVNALTLSPNHWTQPRGNKHYFFMLAGAVSDEGTRPFFNEQLRDDLDKHRKVMEHIAGKIDTSPSEGAELSGLGFSETVRNHLYAKIGSTKGDRIVKVLF